MTWSRTMLGVLVALVGLWAGLHGAFHGANSIVGVGVVLGYFGGMLVAHSGERQYD